MRDMTFNTCRIPKHPDSSIKVLPKLKNDGGRTINATACKTLFPDFSQQKAILCIKCKFPPALCMILTSECPGTYTLTRQLALFGLPFPLIPPTVCLYCITAEASCCFSVVIRPKVVSIFLHLYGISYNSPGCLLFKLFIQ